MPELPDVEGFRRSFRRHGAGKRVGWAEAEPDIVRNTTPQELADALTGHTLRNPERHGKWLICPTDGSSLVLHFGMTGELVWSGAEPERHRHDRLLIGLEDGELRYRDMRKLGGAWLVRSREELRHVIGPIGPDALRISPERFLKRLAHRRGGVKGALMDQRTVAGLGNILVDEILWRARIDPRRKIADLDEGERLRIVRKTRDVLRQSVGESRVPVASSWLTDRRGKKGATCPRCGTDLVRSPVAGRTTYRCPVCQT